MEKSAHNFIANVNQIIDERGVSQRELAKLVGCSHEHLNAVLKGRAKASINLMGKVAEALGMSLSKLVSPAGQVNLTEEYEPYGKPSVTMLPFLEARKDDEGGLEIRASLVTAPIAFKTDWLYSLGSPDQMAFLRLSGQGLGGEIPDNAMLLIDRSQTAIIEGAPFVLLKKGEVVINRLTRKDGKVCACNSSKDQGEPLTEDEDWRIVGRCVWYAKSLN